jgi:hypothetical protein
MPASDDLRDGMGEAFDALSDEFLDGVTITLCKPSENADEFEDVLIIDSKRYFEFSNYRKNFLLEIADDSDILTDAITAATHVQVDDTYYVINAGDTQRPQGVDATWKLFCDLYDRRTQYIAL